MERIANMGWIGIIKTGNAEKVGEAPREDTVSGGTDERKSKNADRGQRKHGIASYDRVVWCAGRAADFIVGFGMVRHSVRHPLVSGETAGNKSVRIHFYGGRRVG